MYEKIQFEIKCMYIYYYYLAIIFKILNISSCDIYMMIKIIKDNHGKNIFYVINFEANQ